ncbi:MULTISPECIES: hypothetical protein [unclassified Mycobacterium]|uniref:hypothetical protein n=1 Tax=unclassified Mycobacterium TaxID=2642494 RepID=UPI000B33B5B5|nr:MULTISPECIES: hypothetical protein [unclassified Mycobacterium]
MARMRLSVSLSLMTTAATGVALFSVSAPVGIARADQQDMKQYVNNERRSTSCPGLTDRADLDNAAQQYANTEKTPVQSGGYRGAVVAFLGSGDPYAKAADSAMAKAKGAVHDCKYTDYGVGFIRHEDRSVDVVTIVLGAENPTPTVSPPSNQAHGPGLDLEQSAVVQARSGTSCPGLAYQTALEGVAQQYARTESPAFAPGQTGFLASGDPTVRAIDSLIPKAHNAIADCSNTVYGVGFVRHDDRNVSVVTVVLAKH